MQTIDEVIENLDRIIDKCSRENLRAGYFAILYRQVTVRVKEGILNGAFDDNARMEKLDVLFASRFIDAFDNYYSGLPVTQSWQVAFDAAADSQPVIMQHLFLGINAHINLDLGIAVVETAPGTALPAIQNDFMKINEILASLVAGVKANLSKVSLLFGLLIGLVKGRDEMLVNFTIDVARDGAWSFAETYNASENKQQCIQERDEKIMKIGSGLIHTGRLLSLLLKVIRLGEFRTVQQNMQLLEGMQ